MTALAWMLATRLAVGAAAAPQTLNIEQAVELAVRTHPQILAAQAAQRAAGAGHKAARGRMLPQLQVSDMQTWSHTNLHGVGAALQQSSSGASFAAPNAAANILNVGVRQPLLGLVAKSQALQATAADFRAQTAASAVSQRDLALEVRSQYLALFQARALADTARASERALLEQVDDAEQKQAAGTLAVTDVLRRRAAAAAAKQQAIAAAAAEEVARTALLELTGLAGQGELVNFSAPTLETALPTPQPLPALRLAALAARPELVQSRARRASAAHTAKAAKFDLLPHVDAQAAWMHLFAATHGGAAGTTDPKIKADAYFVGLSASWPLWQWGGQWYEQRAAHARAEQAGQSHAANERRIGAEVALRHANLMACLGAVEAAVAEDSSAEEAFRVMVATLAVDAATTSDLLQTEAARTQARMNLVRARYDLALAKVALDYAVGKEG